MILYLICDCRRGVLYQDLSGEMFKEWKRSIQHFAVLTEGWGCSLSAAVVTEKGIGSLLLLPFWCFFVLGFSVCVPLGQHSFKTILERLESAQISLGKAFAPRSADVNPGKSPYSVSTKRLFSNIMSVSSGTAHPRTTSTVQACQYIKVKSLDTEIDRQFFRVVVVSMSTHLYAPYVKVLQEVTKKLSQVRQHSDN